MVSCKLYHSDDKKSWDAWVTSCKTPLFFFKRDFLEYHADRFQDCSLLFYDDHDLLAVFPATKSAQVLDSHGGLTYGGLLVSEKTRTTEVQAIFQSLANWAYHAGFEKIRYKAIPYIFYNHASQEDLYCLTTLLNAKLIRRDLSSVIHLNQPLRLSKGKKWLVARAKKYGLRVSDSVDWNHFHALLSTVLERHGAIPVHSANELSYLYALFPQNIVLKVVENNGELLAATLLFKFQTTLHTQYLVTSEKGKTLGALDFLIASCLEEALEAGFLYFSFGISTEMQGLFINRGLMAQKENFGARGMVLDFYEVDLNDKFS